MNIKGENFQLDPAAVNSILGSFIGTDDEATVFAFLESVRKGTPGKVNATTYAAVTRFIVVKLEIAYKKMGGNKLPSSFLPFSVSHLFFLCFVSQKRKTSIPHARRRRTWQRPR